MIMAIFAMSLDLLVGTTGLVSLGHARSSASPAMRSRCVGRRRRASLWLVAARGRCCWRRSPRCWSARWCCARAGIYFIMVTLAFAQMMYFFIRDRDCSAAPTATTSNAKPSTSLFGWTPFDLGNQLHRYYLALALAGGDLRPAAHGAALARSGACSSASAYNEPRMRSLGFPTYRYKLACFVLAGALAGLAGYLIAVQDGIINPEQLGWHHSGEVLMMVILGGMGTLAGPVLGARSR